MSSEGQREGEGRLNLFLYTTECILVFTSVRWLSHQMDILMASMAVIKIGFKKNWMLIANAECATPKRHFKIQNKTV